MVNNLGKVAEEKTQEYMKSLGIKILESNYSSSIGEIDIIGLLDEIIIFTEVKFRNTDFYGDPSEFVNQWQMRRIIKTAEIYILTKGYIEFQPRFDVSAVYGDGRLEYYENAFP